MKEEKIDEVEFLKEESLADLIATIDAISIPLDPNPQYAHPGYMNFQEHAFYLQQQELREMLPDNAKILKILALEIGKDYFAKFFNFTEEELELLDLVFIKDYLAIAENPTYNIKYKKVWCIKLAELKRKNAYLI
jgi:hypothetical protein